MPASFMMREADFTSGTFDFDTFLANVTQQFIAGTASMSNSPDGMSSGDVMIEYFGDAADGIQVAYVVNSNPSTVLKGIWHRRRASSAWGSWQEPAPNVIATANGARAGTNNTQVMTPLRVREGVCPTSTILPETPETPLHLLIGGGGSPVDGLYVNFEGTWTLVLEHTSGG